MDAATLFALIALACGLAILLPAFAATMNERRRS